MGLFDDGVLSPDATGPVLEPQEPAPEPDVDATPSRDDKKRQRFDDVIKERDQAARELDAQRTAAQQLQAQMAQLQQQVEQLRQQTPQTDPYDAQLEELGKQRDALSADFDALAQSGKMTREQNADYQKRARKLDLEEKRLIARQELQRANAQQQEPAGNLYVKANYPDIYSEEKRREWAQARYKQYLIEGRQDGTQLIDLVMNETRQQFGLGKAPPPSDGDKARFSGISSGGAKGSTGSNRIQFTKELQGIAQAAYPTLPLKEACQKWANENGKSLLKTQTG